MNSTSREIRRLNIKSFFNRRGLWRFYRCCLSCFSLFGQRAFACIFDHLFVRLPSLCLEVCLSSVICLSVHFYAVHSIVIVWAGYIRLLFKLLSIKVSKCITTYRESKLLCLYSKYQRRHLHKVGGFTLLYNETKRNETKHKLILHANIHATHE